ncbi:aspartyl/asparaginyl beta-hydroxylase domain-containing protein (plasmid) [Streptomyces cellulosae]|uniref:aspartyl/asparaginyl beta-hydroxylase domain-containing protein n=1 Tax=Streptomyces cellulosae TaxID=1968 RepID=UPI002F907DE0|nr:aspartyl/asparaginyl beta-hydroxylase domain-containing protein [Streptomyces cellulosae]WTB85966.1 aspartyl/asparaginyl beta-hydroxylase domain-containing protein [Streptomyces cellulosae]WTB86413.1 aspartyl/asparaginyl beta-hydroxylase domain-containing protein [Streptomyces cellulosae]WTB86693.1 aspartyl/asparaginyl beta-hydroxylase domain-containing protein [Streptomyces cellulosae]WTB86804.1 aspartyl/asparaginyl beta-hydroxylase domain-containing protein [Streptomyces cellulosae]
MDIDDVLAELRQSLGSKGLERVEECLRILVGQRAPEYLHDDQEPTRLFFPEISALPWHDTTDLAWAAEMESAYPRIREEFLALRAEQAAFAPFEDLYTKELGWQGWDTYQLYRNGTWRDEARERCPATHRALGLTPHGPRDAMFTVLNPGVHITPHTGGVNLLLTAHLPLVVPPGCRIKVGEEERGWQEGKVILFDDSFIHEAWNRGSQQRAVLLWDIWHPELTPVEIEALEILMPRFQRYLMAV